VNIKVVVGTDRCSWYKGFAAALDAKIAQGEPVQYQVVNLDRHDWLDVVAPYDVVIWKPSVMGSRATGHFKREGLRAGTPPGQARGAELPHYLAL
jgi:hypothetical protein